MHPQSTLHNLARQARPFIRSVLASPLLAVCVVSLPLHAPPHFHVVGDILLSHSFQSTPVWSGGALVAIENNLSALPLVLTFDEQGRQSSVVEVRIPGADWVNVRRAAHGANGSIAICGSAKDPDGHAAGYLALAPAGSPVKQLIRTDPYVPTAVAVAEDGTVWTKGAEFESIKRTPSKTDRGIIRHFDASGHLLSEFLPQSSLNRQELFMGIDQLACNTNRVGWYQGRGAGGYFEIVGTGIERYPVVGGIRSETETISGLTLTGDGTVFVTSSVSGNDPRLYTLDRNAKTWNQLELPADGSPAVTNWLLGGEGETLVFKTIAQSNHLRRFAVRSELTR